MSVRDRFPNYISGKFTLSSANTFTTEVVTLPIVRPTAGRGRSTIMEWLWAEFVPTTIDLIADGDDIQIAFSTGGVPSSPIPSIGDGETVAMLRLEVNLETSGLAIVQSPIRVDLQDKNGYGALVATDRINLSGDATGQAGATQWAWRVYYRYVTVSAEEYIGIVQSQLSS